MRQIVMGLSRVIRNLITQLHPCPLTTDKLKLSSAQWAVLLHSTISCGSSPRQKDFGG